MPLILFQFGRQLRLVTQHRVIDKRNTRYPVTLAHIAVRLQVVLTAGKVPHKVTPIHEVYLVAEEEAHILCKGRAITRLMTSAVLIAHTLSVDIGPFLIGLHMVTIRRPHTWERHLKLLHILIRLLVPRTIIAVRLTVNMRSWCILCITTLHNRLTDITFYLQLHRCIIRLAVQQRRITILLTIQIILQREYIIRRVLVHRRIGIRTDNQHRITRITHQHHRNHQRQRIQPTRIDPVLTRQ